MYDQNIILDFEMNPVSREYMEARKKLHREIIEIGAVKVNMKGDLVDKFSCLIKPQYSDDISRFIVELTGINCKELYKACTFEKALDSFMRWIGDSTTRIYSWSDNDYIQLKSECQYKGIAFPYNMKHWMDFQLLYPRIMGIPLYKKLISLKDAAEWAGIDFETEGAHRALYDAKITTELIRTILTGEYHEQKAEIHRRLYGDDQEHYGNSIGVLCGSFFSSLINSQDTEMEFVR